MATTYVDAYHRSLIAGMRQIFGEDSTLAEEEDAKPRGRGKAVKASAPAAVEVTTEGVETK